MEFCQNKHNYLNGKSNMIRKLRIRIYIIYSILQLLYEIFCIKLALNSIIFKISKYVNSSEQKLSMKSENFASKKML
jgi:hypothetical protein